MSGVEVGVIVKVGDGISVGGTDVSVGVGVKVCVGGGVLVSAGRGVSVHVGVGVFVDVGVQVGVGVCAGVPVDVGKTIAVIVWVGVAVGFVGLGWQISALGAVPVGGLCTVTLCSVWPLGPITSRR